MYPIVRIKKKQSAFTLIELLVVISIIALLISILMPALNIAREQARRTVCGSNEKSMGAGLIMYATDYNDRLPLNTVDRWLFDISYWTTDVVMDYGAFDNTTFYCPSQSERSVEHTAIFWQYGQNLPAGTMPNTVPEPQDETTRRMYHRILGYFWLMDTETGRANPPMNPPGSARKEWVRTITSTRASPSLVEFMADVTASDGPSRAESDFAKAYGGVLSRWGIYDRSNHLKDGHPAGGNILFLDGHVAWRHFTEMEHRWFFNHYGNPCFWW